MIMMWHLGISEVDRGTDLNRDLDAYSTFILYGTMHCEPALQSHKSCTTYTTECALQDASHRYVNKLL